MKVLFPDATFDDDAALERGIFPADAELMLTRAEKASDVEDATWRQAEGLIVYIEIPIDAAVIDKLDFTP